MGGSFSDHRRLRMALQQDIVVELLLKHRGKLLGAIRAMVADEHLAEDIFQEVSIAAVSKCHEIVDIDHFGPWLRSAARFQALMALRNRNRLPRSLSIEVLDILEPYWEQFDKQPDLELADALKICLERLGPYARTLIETRYREGKRGNNLAVALKRSMNTVYVALSRVHSTLRECLKRELAMEDGRG
jgi:RNA polymerase sigma-70 factor (ECF subfamily)